MLGRTVSFENEIESNPLGGMRIDGWITRFSDICRRYGHFEHMRRKHIAGLVEDEEADTLLVWFDSIQSMIKLQTSGHPFAWDLAAEHGWSTLTVASDGETWFRDTAIYAFFDKLIDKHFFDNYERVIFYGAGQAGYAAAAFSAAAPAADLVVMHPQATLDPRRTVWDQRYLHMRRTDFNDRYGYAPDMISGCAKVWLMYDPHEIFDAMHAALFEGPHITPLLMRHMGDDLQADLMRMDMLGPLITAVAQGDDVERLFWQLYRQRRDDQPYLRRLMNAVDNAEHAELGEMLVANVSRRLRGEEPGERSTRMGRPVLRSVQ